MDKHIVGNEYLKLEISEMGAELTRIAGVKTGREYLFDADPKYWKRHSPVLFPIVGGLKNKKYRYHGKEYTMSQHGFARDMKFTLEKAEDNIVWQCLKSDDKTKEVYPFDFELRIGYELKDESVEVIWEVVNKNPGRMYFSIGAHPAFNCSITDDEQKADHILVGNNPEDTFDYYHISKEGLAVPGDSETMKCDFPITHKLFARDALIVDHAQAQRLAIADAYGNEYLVMNFEAPLFGIWSPSNNAPFVCLEPWYGRCDAQDYTGELNERVHGKFIDENETFRASYTMSFPMEKV